jgi:hypothetical protein
MEILRVPPYDVVEATLTIPTGFASQTFTASITDMADLSVSTQTFVGESGEEFSISLSAKYDNDYYVEITTEDNVIVIHETYEVVRPYVLAASKGTTATEIAAYSANEELARAVIDSIIREGFYYQKKTLEIPGNGTDYLPMWDKIVRVKEVYENNILVTSRNFGVSKDRTAVVVDVTGSNARFEGGPIMLPAAASDTGVVGYTLLDFPKRNDYRVVIEHGYPTVPSDIVKATALLVTDIECGKLEYYKRYVTSYNTDQFKLQFDKAAFQGTGNLIVDKILSKYHKSITKLGVL